MKVKIKKGFDNNFTKEYYDVIAVSFDLTFYKVIGDDSQEEWLGTYLIEEVII